MKETAKRYFLFVISLFFICFGIALTKQGQLGISPISSVANVMSAKFPSLTFGTWLFLSNCLFLLGQLLLLGRRFQIFRLLQLPMSVLFGYFSDFGMWVAQFLPNDRYVEKLMLVVGGSAVLGFGIALSVVADVMLNSPEAFVKVLADTVNKDFGNIKILFDVCWVTFSICLSLLLFCGKLIGVREGTVISAFLVGGFAKFFRKLLQKRTSEKTK